MNIIRFYNKNRKTIWLTIIAIILIIIAIRSINNNIANENINKKQNEIIQKEKLIKEKDEIKNILVSNEVITDTQIQKDTTLIIDQFIKCCNNKEVQQAYELLTDDCKKELFPQIEDFKKNYYNDLFSTTKLYSKEQYLGSIYKIKFYKDLLSTGNINLDVIEDYYTIVKQKDGKYKINISNYIGQVSLDKTKQSNILNVKVLNKKIYKDYEIYELQIENLTYKNILLDTLENTKSMYLVGNNNVDYYALAYELDINNLYLSSKETKNITIKYNKDYNSNYKVNSLVFENIIKDYDTYKQTNNYKDRFKIVVDL